MLANILNRILTLFNSPGVKQQCYRCAGGMLGEGPFSIDPRTGIISLVGSLEKSLVSYRLNITDTDNGRCCGGSTRYKLTYTRLCGFGIGRRSRTELYYCVRFYRCRPMSHSHAKDELGMSL